jgi:hypothetical protein
LPSIGTKHNSPKEDDEMSQIIKNSRNNTSTNKNSSHRRVIKDNLFDNKKSFDNESVINIANTHYEVKSQSRYSE